MNILIIDSNPVFIKSLKNLIEEFFCDKKTIVDYALNDLDGVYLSEKNHYQIIFVDFDMWEAEVIANLKITSELIFQQEPFFVANSYHTEPGFRLQMEKAGANYLLNKEDIDIDKLSLIFKMISTKY